MYQILLTVHSYWRWLVLISLLFCIIKSFIDFRKGNVYSNFDGLLRKITISIVHIQLILGVLLYTVSPFVKFFFMDISSGLHLREVRFFAIEHSLMMGVSIVLITIGAVKTKRKTDDNQKHRTTLIWFGIALLIILLNIPWEFSPLVNRPSFR
jgi:hypothetical protein